jgi:hypothetical protein
MDFLPGEGQYGVRILLAFLVVVVLMGLFGWLVRRFGSERLGAGSTRGRQPRLAVIDAATVDGRRRLILIRRDNVEHLLMIGGPTDIVVEPNIVRATAARELGPSRATPTADPMSRAAPSAEAIWPPQLEPAAAPAPSPPLRPPRQPSLAEEAPSRRADAEPMPSAVRPPRPNDSLAGLATELSRQPPPPPPIAARAPRERETASEPLRRGLKLDSAVEAKPPAAPEPKPKTVQTAAAAPAMDFEPQPEPVVEREAALNAVAETRLPYREAKPNRESKAAAPKASVYDSLEQEMANLLGRPNKS